MKKEYDKCSLRIIKATYRLLQKENAEKTSINQIAEEAGTNSRTIYRKFENKKDIIDSTKDYYLKIFLDKLNEIFGFNGDEEIDEYLKNTFMKLKNLSDDDFRIIKISLDEVHDITERKSIISKITDYVIENLEEYFKLQKENENLRTNVNIKTLSVVCFGVIFQSLILSRIYDKITNLDIDNYSKHYLDILFNGIKPK